MFWFFPVCKFPFKENLIQVILILYVKIPSAFLLMSILVILHLGVKMVPVLSCQLLIGVEYMKKISIYILQRTNWVHNLSNSIVALWSFKIYSHAVINLHILHIILRTHTSRLQHGITRSWYAAFMSRHRGINSYCSTCLHWGALCIYSGAWPLH